MRRRTWVALAALPIGLLVGDVLYWRYTTQQLEYGFTAWVAQRRATGWTVQFGPPTIGGWPSAATLTASGVKLTGGAPEIPGGLSWSADRVTLRVALLHPGSLEVTPAGSQGIRLADGPDIPFTADQMHLAVPLQQDRPPAGATLTASNLQADVPVGSGTTSALTIAALRGQAKQDPAAGQGEPALTLSLGANSLTLPPATRWPLGPRIESLSLDGAVEGPLPHTGGLTAGATAWRDGGGSVEIKRLALHWGTLDLTGTATLALDPQLQPMGAGSAKVTGYAETLDALAANGALSRSAAIAAKAVLSLLARPQEEGQPDEVEVPLTLQYRTLSMRQVPLVRLPELDWPAP